MENLVRFVCVLVCVLASGYVYAVAQTASEQGPRLHERAWIEQAEKLVVAVTTANPDAAGFRKDVRASRAQLRELMRDGGKDIPAERRQLHMTMVLLDALLDAAAKCQSAGVIVCPAYLVRGLQAQVKNAHSQLVIVEGTNPAQNNAPKKATR